MSTMNPLKGTTMNATDSMTTFVPTSTKNSQQDCLYSAADIAKAIIHAHGLNAVDNVSEDGGDAEPFECVTVDCLPDHDEIVKVNNMGGNWEVYADTEKDGNYTPLRARITAAGLWRGAALIDDLVRAA